jgi:hypothetical protein
VSVVTVFFVSSVGFNRFPVSQFHCCLHCRRELRGMASKHAVPGLRCSRDWGCDKLK